MSRETSTKESFLFLRRRKKWAVSWKKSGEEYKIVTSALSSEYARNFSAAAGPAFVSKSVHVSRRTYSEIATFENEAERRSALWCWLSDSLYRAIQTFESSTIMRRTRSHLPACSSLSRRF